MRIGIFFGRTRAGVNGILQHLVTVFQERFAKIPILVFGLLGIGRQIEKYEYPHGFVSAK